MNLFYSLDIICHYVGGLFFLLWSVFQFFLLSVGLSPVVAVDALVANVGAVRIWPIRGARGCRLCRAVVGSWRRRSSLLVRRALRARGPDPVLV